jgi:arylsulfatase A-like enzyme
MADDLGYGDLGSYGQERILTPNLDALAAEGMRFTQYYAGSTICAPSRCCLMTGLHTGHARIRHNKTPIAEERVGLRPDDLTVAELLKGEGYATAVFGKWGMGEGNTPGTPNHQGFDEFLGRINDEASHYYPEFLWRNEEKEVFEENLNGETGTYSQDLFTDEALSFIEAHQDEPFFLYLPYNYPHANDEIRGDEIIKNMAVPSSEPYTSKPWPQVERNFAAMITRMDRDVGEIISRLQDLGIDRNTCVFFTSDNGPHSEGEHDSDFFESAGPLRGDKRDLLEGGIRVPMIAWWPGTIKAGVVSDQVWASWDFLPTAADMAEAELPPDRAFDGLSMLPALLGRPQQDHEFLYWEIPGEGRFSQAVRIGDWKGYRAGYNKRIKLYDLAEDLREEDDIADRHPEIVAEIARIMENEHTASEDFPITVGEKVIEPEAS